MYYICEVYLTLIFIKAVDLVNLASKPNEGGDELFFLPLYQRKKNIYPLSLISQRGGKRHVENQQPLKIQSKTLLKQGDAFY